MKVSIQVIDQVLKESLKDLPIRVKRELSGELDHIGDESILIALHLVPYDTGKLFKSINILRRAGVNGRSLALRAMMSYAGFVEFGTIYQRAQPYIEPAVDWAREQILVRLPRLIQKVSQLDQR